MYLFQKRSEKTGTHVWHFLCSPKLRFLGIVVSLSCRRWKSSKCSTPLTSNKESVRTVTHYVLIQICLVTMYDSCAGLLLPQQQGCVKCVAHLIISNCAPVPALTFLIIGVNFFSTGLWYRYCRLPSEVSHWLTAFIRIQYLHGGISSEGSAFFLQKTPASYQTLSKGSYPGFSRDWESPLRGFDSLWPADNLPSVSRCLADAGGATCSVYIDSTVHVLLLVRHSPC